MVRDSWISKVMFFPMLLLGILFLGLMIPTFYDWSGADQSRPSPHFTTAFYAVIGFMIVAWIALPILPQRDSLAAAELKQSEKHDELPSFQFNLRTLIAATSFIAIVVAGLTSFRLITIVWIVSMSIFCVAWCVMHDLPKRWKLAALLGCMYFPYAWVLVPGTIGKFDPEHVFSALGLPMFMPSLLLAGLFDQRGDEHVWLFLLLTLVEFAIGVWLIRLGPRRTVAWIIAVLFVSFLGSCFLNAAIRI